MSGAKQAVSRRRKGSKHEKNGCLTCRFRHKKCSDNTVPICGNCKRLNLECIREPARNVVPSTKSGQKQTSEPALTPDTSHFSYSTRWCLPVLQHGGTESPYTRHAMRYYATVLTQHLTVSEQFNSFLTAFLPMAIESDALRDALFAFALGHLSLVDDSYRVAALEGRVTAIKNLAAAINSLSNNINRHETNAAACLTLLTSEVGSGVFDGWYSHLLGTKHIIISATACSSSGKTLHGTEAFKNSSEGQWILRNFAYHDIIGSVTRRKRPLLDGSYLDGITDVVDSYLGVATELLVFIAKISCLDEETAILEHMSTEEIHRRKDLFHAMCPLLETRLQDWRCREDASAGLVALAYAFRSAVLIFLYRLVRSRLTADDIPSNENPRSKPVIMEILQSKIRTQVENTLSHIANIPVGTAPESAILFPLFLAGGEAKADSQVDTVRARLRMTMELRQFRNVSRSLEVLEDVWRLRKTENGDQVDWTHILTSSGGNLLLT